MVYRQKDSLPLQTSLPSSPPPPSPPAASTGGGSRISPAVLFIIVILAVIFFVSGLLHLLVRFLIKKNPSANSSASPQSHHHHRHQHAGDNSDSDALQRQLQQLFHLHDSGLDQAFIDALPVFLYREIIGSKEPFDCAVCLCEFSRDDQLRLLPICGHAFHLDCIDTWLLSNSTCPLCRGALFAQGDAIENPMFDFGEDAAGLEEGEAEEIGSEKRVVPVRLGKFRSTGNGDGNEGGACAAGADDAMNGGGRIARREEGESSSSNLDARRCYSMGSYQYIVGDANLRVALTNCDKNAARRGGGGGGREKEVRSGNLAVVDEDGKRLGAARRGESFSVSKIWQWGNKKGKFPDMSDASSLDGGLPWMNARRSVGDV
ncbi:RING-H2 finger protein ATL46-like [Iris pallida]|uniref:RING-type E3 ubiquitin transferase n=1 Tax=Iris pallida TaxID=29817 RepID=A0AAX6IAW4_IRIPA|nr:RING-H2 finger protein ATL46-like [Iris pallida]KAJ6850379.1 RING-H2 finger protein ATL46-like [Iris pallida]